MAGCERHVTARLLPEWRADPGHDQEKKAPLNREIEERRSAADGADKERRTRQALEIWRRAIPASGTLVEKYLRARGITIPIQTPLKTAWSSRRWT